MGKTKDLGSGMNNQDHISESLETIFLGLKYLNSLMLIRDPGSGIKNLDLGSRMEKIRIWDPGKTSSISNTAFYAIRVLKK
jgi:hypothetical protein